MSLLHVESLSIQFHGAAEPTVRNISFSAEAGKITAIVGESGSGKSITALSILQLNPATYCPTGAVSFDTHDMLSLPKDKLRTIRGNDVSMVFQEPMSALNPLHTIGKQLKECFVIHQPTLSEAEIAEHIQSLLHDVELPYLSNRLHHYPHQLSGGERQRIMIAMAIANRPKLLIADEPTTALDVTTQAKIIALLKQLQQKHNMAILLITHDLHLVRHIADHTIVMQQGHIVEQNATAQLFLSPSHAYTKRLISSVHTSTPAPFDASVAAPLLTTDALEINYATSQRFSLKKASKKQAVKPVSLLLLQGETLGIVGESGSGKTSLGLAIARLIPSEGSIVFQGQDIQLLSTATLRPVRSSLQFVFQDPFASLNPRMTVQQIIREGLLIHYPELSPDDVTARVEDILTRVGLTVDMANRYPHEFSGGQRQRINIARAMILSPSCVIFDEPTSALDVTLQTQIISLLKTFQTESKCSYIFISHDMHAVRSISHKIMVLKNGSVVEFDSATNIFSSPKHDYTKTLIEASSIADIA